jgi:hypothetical protein
MKSKMFATHVFGTEPGDPRYTPTIQQFLDGNPEIEILSTSSAMENGVIYTIIIYKG